MEVISSEDQNVASSKSKDFKYKLLERLNEPETSLTKSLTLAITIQTMFSKDLEVLELLFKFYLEKNQLEMSIDLWENELLKKVNLNETHYFDQHLNNIAAQIVFHLDKNKRSQNNLAQLDSKDEFYMKLFLKLNQQSQEKFIILLLDKHKAKFSFLKIDQQPADPKKQPQQQVLSIDIKDLYFKLVEIKESIYLTRDLLGIYKKFIPDYGLFLIDGLLNCEKSLYINFVQMSTNTSEPMINIERRSLNIMRRLCVVELIPHFINIIDKLDNRHCYRWIEKSLEFFTKYTLSSIKVSKNKLDDTLCLTYSAVKLLNENEIPNLDDMEKFNELNFKLSNLIEYKYTQDNGSPFTCVFKLLDEIGKKLDWPNLPNNSSQKSIQNVEEKLTTLLNMKHKPDMKQSNISVSSLNKQFSFYAIALFFNKLIEFNAISKEYFTKLVMSRKFKYNSFNSAIIVNNTNDFLHEESNEPIEWTSCCLIYCLKLWHKFNSHKEFLTVVTKCLSNSKLDLMAIYKSFLTDYYNNYALALNLNNSTLAFNWENCTDLDLKQKIPALAHLFMSNDNKSDSFQLFFKELLSIIDTCKETNSKENLTKCKLALTNIHFDLFEANLHNVLVYFSSLIIEKFIQIFEQKKSALQKYLSENDQLIGYFLILIQMNITNDTTSPFSDIYDRIYQIIKSKGSFNFKQFSDYIYGILFKFYLNLFY